jgi:hypothetical protein
MKIKKSVIKPIKSVQVSNINFISASKFKFTKNETQLAMRSAMRIRKRASKKFNCKFNEISMSLCLKEAYRRIAQEKLDKSNILSKSNKHALKDFVQKEFGYNNIDTFIRKENVNKFVPKNVQQNIILNIAKLEMMTRQEFVGIV